jgi:hypothetical protein
MTEDEKKLENEKFLQEYSRQLLTYGTVYVKESLTPNGLVVEVIDYLDVLAANEDELS